MLILIGLTILFIVVVAIGTFEDWNEFAFVGAVISGVVLLIALVALPLYRMDVKTDLRHYEALRETVKESRSISDVSHGVERAAIITQVAEKNAWVKDMQYWNDSLFDIWIPDTVDALQPLK